MLLGGVAVDDRLIPELARIVDSTLGGKLTTAYTLRSKVFALTRVEKETILEALEDPRPQLAGLRTALAANNGWQLRDRLQHESVGGVRLQLANDVAVSASG